MDPTTLNYPADNAPMVEFALYYASRGVPVFPCGIRSKAPLIAKADGGHGKDDATTDEGTIRAWWRACPGANIGAATGFLFDVLDVDDGGEETLSGYAPIPQATEVRCPGGGSHIYFHPSLVPLRNGVKFAEGLDFRTLGGYVLLPPSYVVLKPEPSSASESKRKGYSGRYTWTNPLVFETLPPVPMWVVNLIRRGEEQERKALGPLPETLDEGSRNDSLFKRACLMRSWGWSAAEIFGGLSTINAVRCKPPLAESELRLIAESASRYKPERDPEKMIGQIEAEKDEPRSGAISTFKTTERPTGVPTGFDFIDSNTTCGGLADGQMHVVAAYTGGGKTAWMVQVAYNIAKMGLPVCYVTVADMRGEDLFDRLTKNLSGWYGGDEPLDGLLAERWHKARREIEGLPIHIHDVSDMRNGRDVFVLAAWIKAQGNRFRAYIVDYGQELTAEKARSEYECADLASAEMRWVARLINKPVLVGSQITEGNPKMGTMDITKGSRKWEERAGSLLVLKVLEDEARERIDDLDYRGVKGLTGAHLKKNRFGKKNLRAWWQWQDNYAKFEEL